MENVIPLAKDIFWLGVNDHETELFEAIWPLPEGISYNSYLIIDEKITLIDTVKKSFVPEYLDKIKKAIGKRRIDYLIINHIEPDHSGAIKTLLELFPGMQIVGNEKTAEFLKCFYGIDKNMLIVKDGEALNLGAHRLKFFMTPMVHWPETMMTYDEKSKIIFSGDVFGGFGALEGGIFDDEARSSFFEKETLRYFSNVIGKYSPMVQKAIARLRTLDIHLVASTHGPVYKNNPSRIINLYDQWSRHQSENGAVIVYGSMYGNTEKMAGAVTDAVLKENVKAVKVYNISKTNISFIIPDIWRLKALIVGAPTYNTRLFPLIEHLLNVIENDNISKDRKSVV